MKLLVDCDVSAAECDLCAGCSDLSPDDSTRIEDGDSECVSYTCGFS